MWTTQASIVLLQAGKTIEALRAQAHTLKNREAEQRLVAHSVRWLVG
jgi:hypothetical protein